MNIAIPMEPVKTEGLAAPQQAQANAKTEGASDAVFSLVMTEHLNGTASGNCPASQAGDKPSMMKPGPLTEAGLLPRQPQKRGVPSAITGSPAMIGARETAEGVASATDHSQSTVDAPAAVIVADPVETDASPAPSLPKGMVEQTPLPDMTVTGLLSAQGPFPWQGGIPDPQTESQAGNRASGTEAAPQISAIARQIAATVSGTVQDTPEEVGLPVPVGNTETPRQLPTPGMTESETEVSEPGSAGAVTGLFSSSGSTTRQGILHGQEPESTVSGNASPLKETGTNMALGASANGTIQAASKETAPQTESAGSRNSASLSEGSEALYRQIPDPEEFPLQAGQKKIPETDEEPSIHQRTGTEAAETVFSERFSTAVSQYSGKSGAMPAGSDYRHTVAYAAAAGESASSQRITEEPAAPLTPQIQAASDTILSEIFKAIGSSPLPDESSGQGTPIFQQPTAGTAVAKGDQEPLSSTEDMARSPERAHAPGALKQPAADQQETEQKADFGRIEQEISGMNRREPALQESEKISGERVFRGSPEKDLPQEAGEMKIPAGQAPFPVSAATAAREGAVRAASDQPAALFAQRQQAAHEGIQGEVRNFVITRQDGASIEISLQPEGLGKLDIGLVFDKGVVSAQIQASHAAARDLVEQNISQIVNALTQEGIAVGGFSVSLRQGREGEPEVMKRGTGGKKGDHTEDRVKGIARQNSSRGAISIFA